MHERKLLLIVHRFPPMGGVGSRRWAKFCKFFCRDGWEIHVITVEYPWVDNVNWLQDVSGLDKLTVTRLATPYPSRFLRPDGELPVWQLWATRMQRFLYQRWQRYIEPLHFDHASRWAETLVPFAADYVRRHDIRVAIAAGPPSSLHIAGALLKAEVPHLRIVQDYRDPWNNVHDYQMERVGNAITKATMLTWEHLAVTVADSVVVVTEQMKRELEHLFSLPLDKVQVIPNGFDREDYEECSPMLPQRGGEIRLVYLGSLGRGAKSRFGGLEMLLEAVETLEEPLRSRFVFDIYSERASGTIDSPRSADRRDRVHFHPMIPSDQVARALARAHVCLSINRIEDDYAVGTKVYDYMAMGKPIFQIAHGGELAEKLRAAGQFVTDYERPNVQECLRALALAADKGTLLPATELYQASDLRWSARSYREHLEKMLARE